MAELKIQSDNSFNNFSYFKFRQTYFLLEIEFKSEYKNSINIIIFSSLNGNGRIYMYMYKEKFNFNITTTREKSKFIIN